MHPTGGPDPDPPAAPSATPPAQSLRRDVASAYLASGAKVASWAVVSAFVYRVGGPAEFAMVALVRGTLGVLNYTALGLAPAMIRMLAESASAAPANGPVPALAVGNGTLQYETPRRYQSSPDRLVYSNGLAVAGLSAAIALLLTLGYAAVFENVFTVPARLRGELGEVVILLGLGTVLRLFSDAAGSVLQTRGRIAVDNAMLAAAECVWVVAAVFLGLGEALNGAARGYAVAGLALAILRTGAVARLEQSAHPPSLRLVQWPTMRTLLGFGSLVLLAQLADYLYAPVDYILIKLYVGTPAVAAYAPAVQVDAALLMLVTALAAVLLPRSAVAHAQGRADVVRSYYVRGTLASAALLAAAAGAVWLLWPWIARLWFGPDPPATASILPLVLIHTVLGGSSAVGRSVLLAVGKVKPFAASVLAAGVANVAISYGLARYTDLGLRGIVLGTIIVVTARCLLWQPWYVLRTLRNEGVGADPVA